MLINLSNHPLANWSEEQKKAAEAKFGEVTDLPFPAVNPEATIEEVIKLTEKYRDKCMEIFTNANKDPQAPENTVHIMGEMTFTYTFVKHCRHKGINAVASTTERKVVENENGIKTSVFTFKQFRGYFSESELHF